MAEIGRWNNHIFEVSPNVMRSFDDLTVVGQAETEEKTAGSQKYVSYKNGGSVKVTMTIILSALLGCNVRDEAMALVDEARNGSEDYLYLDGKKLVTCPLMLTNAEISQTEIGAGNQWLYAEAKVTFKQCDKFDGEAGGSGSSGGGSGGGSHKTKKKSGTTIGDVFKEVSDAARTVMDKLDDLKVVKDAQAYITEQVNKVAKAKSLKGKTSAGGATKMRATR